MANWEARLTLYRNGRRIEFNDALGDSPTEALYNAHNDLELWAQRYEVEHPRTTDKEK